MPFFDWAQALIGGVYIGTAVGGMWYFSGKVAGNSGVLGSVVKGKWSDTKDLAWRLAYIGGMVGACALFSKVFGFSPFSDTIDLPLSSYVLGGLLVGFGTSLGNGCTSGHGLAGISRYGLRSLVATCTFVCTAFMTAFALKAPKGTVIPPSVAIAPPSPAPSKSELVTMLGVYGLLVSIGAVKRFLKPKDKFMGNILTSLWVGVVFGCGLGIGGMTKQQKVTDAFDIWHVWDPTLWLLFTTALVTTFAFFRLTESKHVQHCSCWDKPVSVYGDNLPPTPKGVDWKLILGAAVFGVGWGYIGICPGPMLCNLARFSDVQGLTRVCTMVAAVAGGSLVADKVAAIDLGSKKDK